jgi:hypothetical protein
MTTLLGLRAAAPIRHSALAAAIFASFAAVSSFATSASAAPPAPDAATIKDASTHFEHGVQLYNEADYRASLVEFKRAYQLAPNPAVLYNIGETHYQLQNYAAASAALEQYLSESGPSAGHRAEVEQTMQVLQSRVGRLEVQTSEAASISVDDETIGTTPFASPPKVSIGHRKVTATREGQAPVSQFVDISAGETAHVRFNFALPTASTAASSTAASSTAAPPEKSNAGSIALGLWIGTGALAAGSIVTGVVALHSGGTLSDDKSTFGTSRSTLDSDASKTKNFSIVADALGGAAVLTGVAALVFTFKAHADARDEAQANHVGLHLLGNGASLEGTF